MQQISDDEGPIHWLDLPNLRLKPKADELNHVLSKLVVQLHNFDEIPDLDQGTTRWLTQLVAHDLEWIDESTAQAIRDSAAHRLAQQCGITARADVTRAVDVGELKIQLLEPGLTTDKLGMKTWGAALVLAKRLVAEPSLLEKSCIELGAGTGLVGITAAKLGAQIVLTDLEEIVVNLERNVLSNNLNCPCHVLDWSDPHSSVLAGQKFDLILISDPVYSVEHPEALLASIAMLDARKVILEVPLRPKYDNERNAVYTGLYELGYNRDRFEYDDGRDDFGPSKYVFSYWTKDR
ncbi:Protein-lysine N-methyltransferase EFM2 [Wickerhamiella sorbophila]|uniref:Protein-lysine N-methyltransferase EFM2 n=1 Tax=Wickerhamiella sorbophila TaxID=45607 RepID=A0A2T0FGL2_9ASCO|nr:Protein-lysine N-methyltransferase EFM2 [Wickerhamiella sorbophila]PRT54125.1 Protein-lysine N-methyltransferase EFM2 [Wickerhamiella sorbophila]